MSHKSHRVLWSVQSAVLSVLAAIALFSPGVVSNVRASTVTIDEEQPGTIPSAVVSDWKAQDGTNYSALIESIKADLPEKYKSKVTGSGEAGYLSACHWRRVSRMAPHAKTLKKMLYARHHDIGGSIIGYTEDLNSDGAKGLGTWGMTMSKSSDYSNGNKVGTAIHLLEFDNYYPEPTELISGGSGCVRDPCPTYDGNKIVFAWSKDNNGYSIFDFDMETEETRQLTDDPPGVKVSDMEPCVTPTGDIIFCSSRCFQSVDCNINLVSNLYLMDCDGKYLRRISYDQVNIFYPTMNQDGSVMYTRWEYNDRNVANCFGIFTMNQDGTKQQEFFGNQTGWPATFNQARMIPNTMRALATIGGHMGPYAGDLVLVKADMARNGISAVELIAPKRTTSGSSSPYNMSGVPEEDKLFQNPYPLNEKWFLISYRKTSSSRFGIYLMSVDGDRELIASNSSQSLSQPISLAERDVPIITTFGAEYTKYDSTRISVSNVYYGQQTNPDPSKSMTRVPAGSVKKMRVVAMEYRTDPAFGNTGSNSYQMGPVGRFGCSWEAKWICGEVDVAEDGSAACFVPPRTPIFLQLIAEDGTCIQTMRSWMTLQPGERFDCFGCHEDKHAAPPTSNPTNVTPVALKPLFDIPQEKGSFHFDQVIQPILDKHCVKSGCHNASHSKLNLEPTKFWTNDLSDAENKSAYRYWSRAYYNLSQSKYVSCNALYGGAEGIPPKSIGSANSKLVKDYLLAGHKNVEFDEGDIEKICAWIDLSIPYSGTYSDDMKDTDKANYLARLQRRIDMEEIEAQNIQEFIADGGYKQEKYGTITNVRMPGAHKSVQNVLKTNNGLKVNFMSTERMLNISLPSEGKIKLLNLQGRQILSKKVSREAFLKNAQQSIKLNIPAGTYIVKFSGVKLDAEEVVSVL